MVWHTQHLSRRALFTNARMLSIMAAQALDNQLQKPCLLSVPVSSRFPTMMFCADDRCGDPPTVRQGSVRKVTHEKRTSGSNALLAPTQIFPPHILQGCCFCAWLSSKQYNYSRSPTAHTVSKCGHQLPSVYPHTCAYLCASTPWLFLPHPDTSNACAASLSTRASIRASSMSSA